MKLQRDSDTGERTKSEVLPVPKLQKNARAIASAAAGAKLVYQIDGAPGLNLAALGNGKASWRLRYRPARGVEKRWHTIGDASTIKRVA